MRIKTIVGLLISGLILISLVFFAGCAESDSDNSDATNDSTSGSTNDPGNSNANSISITVAGDGTMSGNSTLDSSTPLSGDPFVEYYYDATDDSYYIIFARDYDAANNADYISTFDKWDGYDILVLVELKGTPQTGDINLGSSDAFNINGMIYSQAGSNIVYYSGPSIGNASMTITSAAPNAGDQLVVSGASMTLCKYGPPVNCSDTKSVTDLTADITRATSP